MNTITKVGWAQIVGSFHHPLHVSYQQNTEHGVTYFRTELMNVHLSQTAALLLLQGASLFQVLSDVILPLGFERRFFSPVFVSPLKLHEPPPRLTRVVLVSLAERPVQLSPEEVLKLLLPLEV